METAPMVPDSLRRRIEIPRRPIVQHARVTRNIRYEAARQAIRLERRISDIERLVGFLTDMMFGLISAFFAIVAVAFADSDVSWQDTICVGVLAFLISMWMANFFFSNARRWCLK
jgi:ABC-type transport system involved in cytochrome bd biosynthesis fused ATPase/permease subunit